MAEDNVVFQQKNPLGFDIKLKLLGGRELQVGVKGRKVNLRYSVDILSLESTSKRQLCIAWNWLILCLTFIIGMLLMLKFLPPYLGESKNLSLGIILLAGLIGGILCLVQFWKYSLNKQIFYSLNAHVPIIELSVGKPTKDEFSSFINAIELSIKKIREHMDLSEDKQLIGEMKMLRRLSEDGVISHKSYGSAKEKIFSGFDSQVINREG